ncbi:hypothetical protein [Amphritea balenae]|uniref:Uncharacterized protein n=1 Tax=Amphritea balenae TaxID=452629 RepID=A0A3P1SI37_9GAMM|nr:hypothetical protein [Amphritea balenae]RRC96931.1 hypothetical protein EHS89_19530 [Amphritea balenae]GGK85586.1 hypothetical protein GCM10007941_40080 [Amphritea balenae]
MSEPSASTPCFSDCAYSQLITNRYLNDSEVSNPVRINDKLSIHLSQAFIKDFPEWILPTKGEYTPGSSNGEIVIIAYACEQGIEGCDLLPSDKSRKEGRVVYYSDGVQEGQALNLSYLPIYGPITYTGKPLILQLHIMELDIQGEQSSNLIKTLADYGKKSLAPATATLSLLEDLGLSLLQGEQHDRIFSFSMVLAPEGGVHGVPYPHLSAGNYLFVRQDNSNTNHWDNLKFDTGRGRLMTCTTSSSPQCVEYQENTYMVVQIQKGFAEASLDKQQTLAVLLKELESKQDASTSEIEKIWRQRLNQIVSSDLFSTLSDKLYLLEQPLPPTPNADKPVKLSQWQQKKDNKALTASRFFDQFTLALNNYRAKKCWSKDNADSCSDKLSNSQIDSLVVRIRALPNINDSDIPLNLSSESATTGLNSSKLKAPFIAE